MRHIVLFAFALVLAACGGGGTDSVSEPKPVIPVQLPAVLTMASPGAQARGVVIRTQADWEQLWTEAHKPMFSVVPPLPAVDFTTQQIVGVFMGTFATGGYSTTITGITREGETTVVHYHETSPPPGAAVAQAFTAPAHLVVMPASTGPVVFRKE